MKNYDAYEADCDDIRREMAAARRVAANNRRHPSPQDPAHIETEEVEEKEEES